MSAEYTQDFAFEALPNNSDWADKTPRWARTIASMTGVALASVLLVGCEVKIKPESISVERTIVLTEDPAEVKLDCTDGKTDHVQIVMPNRVGAANISALSPDGFNSGKTSTIRSTLVKIEGTAANFYGHSHKKDKVSTHSIETTGNNLGGPSGVDVVVDASPTTFGASCQQYAGKMAAS